MAGLRVGQAFGMFLLPGFGVGSPWVPGHSTSMCNSGVNFKRRAKHPLSIFISIQLDIVCTTQNIGTQGVQELFFCDLKPPGGSSTQWTLKSYDKGNSFMYTGPGFPAFNVIIEFNFLVQTLTIVVPKYFATILQDNTFPSFSPF